MSITMDLDSLYQRLYESDRALHDEQYSYLTDEYSTLNAYLQSELIVHLECADSWSDVGHGIYSQAEVDFLASKLL